MFRFNSFMSDVLVVCITMKSSWISVCFQTNILQALGVIMNSDEYWRDPERYLDNEYVI